MSESLSAVLKNKLSELERVSQLIHHVGERYDLQPKTVFQINLALDEIIANIILYAYDDDQEHRIDINVSLQDGMIVLVVVDDGKPFNPFNIVQPDLEQSAEERKIGGLGFCFVRQLMDEVEYEWQEGRNVLIMKKKQSQILQKEI